MTEGNAQVLDALYRFLENLLMSTRLRDYCNSILETLTLTITITITIIIMINLLVGDCQLLSQAPHFSSPHVHYQLQAVHLHTKKMIHTWRQKDNLHLRTIR